MNASFDFYEYAGVIVPGAVLLFGAMWLIPELRAHLGSDGVALGELGLFIVLSYALGQLIQSVGNIVEAIVWWPFGGLPSKRILAGEALTVHQQERLSQFLRKDGMIGETISDSDARAIVREMYAIVAAADKAARIDKFNGIYGMMRGLCASLLLLVIGCLIAGAVWQVLALLALGIALALHRAHRFGWHYGRELVAVYLANKSGLQ